MRYDLTKAQWMSIFSRGSGFDKRLIIWSEKFGHLPVTYNEIDQESEAVIKFSDIPGYWGFIEGDEKYITWIVLQL